jgi:hypothetical protein
VGRHKRAQTASGPSQSPSRSLETARPGGTCLQPGAKVSGSPTDLLTPWYDGRAEIIPFQYLPVLPGGKGTSLVGWDTGNLPSQGKNYGYRTPPVPCVPHGGTTGASVPPHPLGVARSQSRGWRVIAPVAPVPNCPNQESICANLQCSCRSQSLEQPPGE